MHPVTKVLLLGSPLVHGMDEVFPPQPAPAQRLVLAVGTYNFTIADGLRADKLYENALERAPFLKEKVFKEGRWGISHTRVPTESRPGHVALIAGFYEDVSAVTKGWKTNPVNFDSVFNQSRHTWSFGSPDILPMFAYGASDPNKVEMFMYEAEDEDFADDDASKLDTWVFDHFEQLFSNAKTNATLDKMLRSDKIVFFLHLLGLDTNGHGFRPYSEKYLSNIGIVDSGLKEVERLIENFYKDGKTAYVVTSDHGMSNRGNHGDGDPQNTETPLIAWGAGVSKPDTDSPSGHDDYSISWRLNSLQRNDVNQADIAPLMSSIIGVAFPKNSVGKLPIPYLKNTDRYKAEAMYANSKGILAQYLIKASKKAKTELVLKPYSPLLNYTDILNTIEEDIERGEYEKAESLSSMLIDLSIEGLRYYQTYDWLLLRTIVSLGYLGWIAYSVLFIIHTYYSSISTSQKEKSLENHFQVQLGQLLIFAGLSGMLFYKESPVSYYAYSIFPIYFWGEVLKQIGFVKTLLSGTFDRNRLQSYGYTGLYLASLELLVLSYFYRELLTVYLLLMGLVWPLTMKVEFRNRHLHLINFWRLLSATTCVFTLLPVELEENITLILFGGYFIVASALVALLVVPRYINASLPFDYDKKASASQLKIVWFQILIILTSLIVTYHTSKSLEAKKGLPVVNAVTSWIILASSILIPIFDRVSQRQHYLYRVVIIYLSFAPIFILLSVSYETLFYFFYSMTVFTWLMIEQQLFFYDTKEFNGVAYTEVPTLAEAKNRTLRPTDMRIASFFLFFINMAFFGTGNMASLASFTISSVYRFTTLFNPFLMAALIILKLLIPFFLLSSTLSLLSRCLELPPFSLFLLVLSTTDIMTLNFFFLVTDSGSWLEIGTTISHFVMSSSFIVFQILLFSASHLLVGGVLIPKKSGLKLE
ncbi:Glycosyl phosphatidyl inositol anchor synthesis [Boothiomyces sp. JEL0838]|nr:Glycosyl phosphatidyl inositol anchor synthesis [Boothiomyces sp. JEL0838]